MPGLGAVYVGAFARAGENVVEYDIEWYTSEFPYESAVNDYLNCLHALQSATQKKPIIGTFEHTSTTRD